MTKIQKFIDKYKPCKEATNWLESQSDLRSAYKNCTNSSWMWWAIRKLDLADKNTSVKYANICAEHVKHLKNYAAANADAAAAANAAASYASYAGYAAANAAKAAKAAAAADAYAAAAADAAANAANGAYAANATNDDYKKEQTYQCEQLRILVPYNKIKI